MIDETPGTPPERSDWERMIASFRQAAPRAEGAPPWLEDRVMAEIESLPPEGVLRRAARWLLRPVAVRIPPAAGLLGAAVAAALLLLPGRDASDVDPVPGGGAAQAASVEQGDASVIYVQFALEAPDASSVAVAGDFSEWQPSFSLEDVDGDGVWTGRVPVRPGVHTYMFVIDGTDWRTDPRAERYIDDGFGNRNAILAVAPEA